MPDNINLPIFKCLGLKHVDFDQLAYKFVNSDGSFERVRYGDIYRKTNQLANALKKSGIGKGDTFAVLMKNHPEFLYSLFAALSTGAVCVPVDPRSKGRKLAFQLLNTRAKGLILADEFVENYLEIKNELKDVKVLGVVYKKHHQISSYSGLPSFKEIEDTMSNDLPEFTLKYDKSRPVQIIHTSGTTGDPKGVVLKAKRFSDYKLVDKMIWKYRKGDVLYTGLSMTHGNAQAVTVFPSLANPDIHAVISEKFTKSKIWDICREHGCTTFSLLGGMMAGIFNEPPKTDDAQNPVEKVISAGTPRSIWKDFENRFNVRIHEWYAAIEGGLAHNRPGKGPVGSFGKPNPLMYRMKIVDENGRKVLPGEKGELISKLTFGKTQVNYFGKKKESNNKTKKGWLRSGDICHYDNKGFLFFDFRKGGGLRRQGDFIQPDLVEKVIGSHENISEVCVYGVPASSGAPGESDLVAAVVVHNSEKLDKEDIKKICLAELEKNSVPTYLQVVDEIPKSVSEKHLSRLLKDDFENNMGHIVKL